MAGALPPPGSLAPAVPSAAATAEVRALIAQQADLIDALDKGAMRALLPAMVDARNEMAQGLAAWLRTAPDGNERYTAQRHRKALLILQTAIDRAVALGHDVQDTLVENGKAATRLSVRNLTEQVARFGEVFGETVTPIDLDTAAMLAKGDRLRYRHYKNSAARYAGQVGEDIRHQLAVGVASNETFAQLKARLVKLGGPSGLVYTRGKKGDDGAVAEQIAEGLFRRHRYWAERLVRTELIEAYNQGHSDSIDLLNDSRDADTTDEYLKRWDSSLDKRICPICRGLDRTVARVGGKFRGGYDHPPAHPNCRCVLVAWHADWGDIAGEVPPHRVAPKKLPPRPPAPPKPKRVRPPSAKTAANALPPPPAAPLPELFDGTPTAEAVARGKWNEGRAALERDIAGHEGYPLAFLPYPNHKESGRVKVRKLPRGVGGLHWSNHGRIDLSPETAERAQKFAREWTADAEAVRARLGAAAAAVTDPNGKPTPEQCELVAAAKGHKTLVHEVMHAHGPMRGAYKGYGVMVEEIATEVAARRYMRMRYGMPLELFTEEAEAKGTGHSSYQSWIGGVTRGVATEFQLSEVQATQIMERAADRYKRRPTQSIQWHLESVRALSEDIAAEAGHPEAEDAIKKMIYRTAEARAPRRRRR